MTAHVYHASMDQGTRPNAAFTAGPRLAYQAWSVAARQPNWVTRVALTVFLLVVAIPVFLLMCFALLAGIIVFGVLAGINTLLRWARGVLPRDDGRKNVRVVRRRD